MFHLNLYTKLLITKSLFPDNKNLDKALALILQDEFKEHVNEFGIDTILNERPKNSQLIPALSELGLTAERIAKLLSVKPSTVYYHKSKPSSFEYVNQTMYYLSYGVGPKRSANKERLPDYSAKQNKPVRYTLFPLVINYTYIEDLSYIETEPISE